jgi:hypothetical protein
MSGGEPQSSDPPSRRLPINLQARIGAGFLVISALYYSADAVFSFDRGLLSMREVKLVTGTLIVLWIAMLWKLFSTQELGNKQEISFWTRRKHELLGATLPVPYLLHAEHLGYGTVWWLSFALGATIILGLLNPTTLEGLFVNRVNNYPLRFKATWLVAHIGLSVVLLFLIALHIYTAVWYH